MAAPGSKQGGAVCTVTGGLHGRLVFWGAPPLDGVLRSRAGSPLSRNVTHLIEVRRASIGVFDWEPTDRIFLSHVGVARTIRDELGDMEDIVAGIGTGEGHAIGDLPDPFGNGEGAPETSLEFGALIEPR
ncbi:hypothetical protein, conserved [Eimeria brunetti]|uniref:Uncharacterized protein n=1 Tax=Eimeria brunetti TaxID=51314 RepID=U6LCZ3_9EIME|nr:hypothetical protein, conserved [Eimeria brunetti]